jgi:hypothetical protein
MENPIMKLATFNQCVDNATGANKIGHKCEPTGSRHAGEPETLIMAIRAVLRAKGKNNPKHAKLQGRHKKVAGRHAAPRRSFF